MSKKGYAKFVIAAGVLIMLIGMNMDVTVGYGSNRVANIHLISQQQNLMMFGGFVFLGGLILFAVARMKQTPEDEEKEEAKNEEAAEARIKKAEAALQKSKELSQDATRAVGYAWSVSKSILFKIAIATVAMVVIMIIIYAYIIINAKNKMDESEKIKAEQTIQDHVTRSNFLKNVMNTGIVNVFAFGEANSTQVSNAMGGSQLNNGRIECSESQCTKILNDATMASAIKSIQFKYCTKQDDNLLTQVELFYNNEGDANTDYESLKVESLTTRSVGANISRVMSTMPYIITISQKQGGWDVCGSE